MMVESRMSHSRSGSCRASKTRCQVPFLAQRSSRRHTAFQLPKRSGRSRQGAPVLAIHRTASMKSRLSRAVQPGWPGRPGNRSLIRSQLASEIAWRCGMAGPPWRDGRPAFYQNYPDLVHTTYGLLFEAASRAVLELAAEPKYLGAQVGLTAVLHTWGQTLALHPRLHVLATGGGLSYDRQGRPDEEPAWRR